jgi:hypothetical protein
MNSRISQPTSNTNEGIPMEAQLSSRHRDTIDRIFSHPTSRNIEWRQVVSLLETIGTVTHEHNGKLKVALGPETELLPAPHGKDVDVPARRRPAADAQAGRLRARRLTGRR